jgi:hypothetical protein
MELGTIWEAYSSSTGQKFSRLVKTQKFSNEPLIIL